MSKCKMPVALFKTRPDAVKVSKSEMDSQIQTPKILIRPLWLCIHLRLYPSLHCIALKYHFTNIFLPKSWVFFFIFKNCTLLQTTAFNGVKHHRKNAGIQQKSSCLSTTSNKPQKTFRSGLFFFYKSNWSKEYILKSEVKTNWLKNLEEKKEKKKLCTDIYKFIDWIFYRFSWPFEVRSIKSNTASHSALSTKKNGSKKEKKRQTMSRGGRLQGHTINQQAKGGGVWSSSVCSTSLWVGLKKKKKKIFDSKHELSILASFFFFFCMIKKKSNKKIPTAMFVCKEKNLPNISFFWVCRVVSLSTGRGVGLQLKEEEGRDAQSGGRRSCKRKRSRMCGRTSSFISTSFSRKGTSFRSSLSFRSTNQLSIGIPLESW